MAERYQSKRVFADLFTHGAKSDYRIIYSCKYIYNLNNNPCKKVKKMGKSDADKLNFWTKDEYDCFINGIDRESKYYVIFEILFWTGCREGEMLALTKEDVDFLQKMFCQKNL